MHAFREEFRCELRKLVRDPAFVLPSLGFPIAFFLLFGVMLPFAKTDSARWIVMANYAGFAVLASSLFAASLPLARERETGVYALKRTTPLTGSQFLSAKLLAAALFATISASAVFLLACACYGFVPDVLVILAFVFNCLLTGSACASLGLLIGSYFRVNAASVLVNLVFMPMAFLGGLAMPLQVMPKIVQQGAIALPSFHIGELLRASLSPELLLSGTQVVQAAICLFTLVAISLMLATRKLARSVD
jgi:ABC-2 type transport system permease protein